MKEFNLEKALAGKPVITRAGKRLLQIHYEENYKRRFPIVAAIEGEGWKSYKERGKYHDCGDSPLDLFMASTKKEGWINLYEKITNDELLPGNNVFGSKEEAEKEGKVVNSYITTIKIEWEE